ncbi:hypothetical protein AALA22_09080 [Anaerovoracaceae bacterium 41-7]
MKNEVMGITAVVEGMELNARDNLNNLLNVLLGGEDDVVHQFNLLDKVLHCEKYTYKQRLEMSYEYLKFVLGKGILVETNKEELPKFIHQVVIDPKEVEPVKKYNRIPFDKKMELINIHLNNPKMPCTKIASMMGINPGTARSIIKKYKEKNPDIFKAMEK